MRTDLPAAYQAVQATHAAILAARQSLIRGEHPSLVVCGVPNQQELLAVSDRLAREGVLHAVFYEDDVDGNTALCTESVEGARRKLFRTYKLLQ